MTKKYQKTQENVDEKKIDVFQKIVMNLFSTTCLIANLLSFEALETEHRTVDAGAVGTPGYSAADSPTLGRSL